MSTAFLFTTLPCFHINEVRIDRLVQLVEHLEFSDEIVGDGIEDDVRETILSYIKGLEDIVASGEIAVYQQTNDTYKVWLTGGMSVGDAPTDAFEVLAALGSFDTLWETMEAFAIDDLQEEAYLSN
jgi:hypothetical protein